MADHARKQIRDAILERLAGLPTTGDRVFTGRVHPVQRAEKPLLLLWSREEPAAPGSSGRPVLLERTYTLVVEALAENADPAALEDTLDRIAAEVEAALGGDPHLGGLATDMQLVRTDWDFDGSGAVPNARIGLGWQVLYRTAENDATAIV